MPPTLQHYFIRQADVSTNTPTPLIRDLLGVTGVGSSLVLLKALKAKMHRCHYVQRAALRHADSEGYDHNGVMDETRERGYIPVL